MVKLFVPSKAPSHRQERVAEELRFLICKELQKDNLPVERDDEDVLIKPNSPITITHVTISPDLRHAQIGIMPLGGIDQDTAVKYMKANAWFLRTSIAKQLKTRVTPELRFYLDAQFDNAAKIDAIIDNITKS